MSNAALAERVRALEAVFRTIAIERMAGLPMLHPGLRVQAVGFAALVDEPGMALGVLVTPWFMNLVRLPLAAPPQPLALSAPSAPPAPCLPVGRQAQRRVGAQAFDFLGGFEPGLGAFEASSLFSPMTDFADHGAAVATAFEVLKLLRGDAAIEPVAAPRQAAEAWAVMSEAATAQAAPSKPRPALDAGFGATAACEPPLAGAVPSASRVAPPACPALLAQSGGADMVGTAVDLERPARRGFLLGRRSSPGATR